MDFAISPARHLCLLLLAAVLLPAQPAAPAPEVYDGFEGVRVGRAWDLSRCEPGSVVLQSTVVRAGKSAAMITVHPGDKSEGPGPLPDQPTERDELRERRDLAAREGDGFACSFSIFLPKDFPVVPTRLVLAQWKQDDTRQAAQADSPVVAVRYQAGELAVTLQSGREQLTLFSTNEDVRGRWLDFVFHLRFTRAPDGLLRVWLNGNPVCDFHGATAYSEKFGYARNGRFYFRLGLSRDRMAAPMTAYFDEYRKRPLTGDELQ